jgi:hypothetical protein
MRLVQSVLRLEGVAIFAAATWAYFTLLDEWWLAYAALLLAPDLSMVGYLRDTRLGAVTYNLVHNEALPVVLVVAGIVAGSGPIVASGLILAAHVGMDRALGYGLKLPTRFTDTHLQRLEPSPGA